MNHASFFSFFSVISIALWLIYQLLKSGSHYLWFIYLVVQFQYMCIAVSGWLTLAPWETLLSTDTTLCTVSFASVLHVEAFPEVLTSHLLPYSLHWFFSYICNTVRLFVSSGFLWQQALHIWNKFHLLVVYNSFYTFLDYIFTILWKILHLYSLEMLVYSLFLNIFI